MRGNHGSNGLPLSGGSVPWKYTSYTAKTQYAVSVGAMENGTVSVRTRGGEDLGAMTPEEFTAKCLMEIAAKSKEV